MFSIYFYIIYLHVAKMQQKKLFSINYTYHQSVMKISSLACSRASARSAK